MPSSLGKRRLSWSQPGSNASSSKRRRTSPSSATGASAPSSFPSHSHEQDAAPQSDSSATLAVGSATERLVDSRSDWMATVLEAAPCSHTADSYAQSSDSDTDSTATITGDTSTAWDVASVFRHSLSPTRYVLGITAWDDLAHELELAEGAGYNGHAVDVIDTALALGVECLPDDIAREFCFDGPSCAAEDVDSEACGEGKNNYVPDPERVTVADVLRWRVMDNFEDIRAEVVAEAGETSSEEEAELEEFIVSVCFPSVGPQSENESDGEADDYDSEEEDKDSLCDLDDAELDEELCGERISDPDIDGDNISAALLQVALGVAYNNSLEAQEFVNGAILSFGAGGGDESEDELVAILAEGVVDPEQMG